MSPEEVEALHQVGDLLLSRTGIAVTAALLYGPYVTIFAYCARHLLHKRKRSALILLGILSVLSLLLTINLIVALALLIATIQGYVITNPGQPLLDAYAHDKLLVAITTYCLWFSNSGSFFVIGDIVVAWRVWVLWPSSKAVRITLMALLVATAGSAIASGVLHMTTPVYDSLGVEKLNPSSVTNIIFGLSVSLSIITNVIATALFSYRAYQHRATMKALADVQATQPTLILLFLAESGAAFCILQIIYQAITLPDNPRLKTLNSVSSIWQILTNYAAAVYPMMVIFLVNRGSFQSHTDSDARFSDHSGINNHSFETHMRFANPSPSPVPIFSENIGHELETSDGRSSRSEVKIDRTL